MKSSLSLVPGMQLDRSGRQRSLFLHADSITRLDGRLHFLFCFFARARLMVAFYVSHLLREEHKIPGRA